MSSTVQPSSSAWRRIAASAAALLAGLRVWPSSALRMVASWVPVKSVIVVWSWCGPRDCGACTAPSPAGEPVGAGAAGARVRGAFALGEEKVAGLAQPLDDVAEVADMAPVHLVRRDAEVVVGEGRKALQHRVDLAFAGDEGVQGVAVVGALRGHRHLHRLDEHHQGRCGADKQGKYL